MRNGGTGDGIGGERWGCLSQDRASRFVVAWAAGPRTAALARAVVRRTRERTAEQAGVGWVSDGWIAYPDAIWDAYTDAVPLVGDRPGRQVLRLAAGVSLTQGVKHRRGRRLSRVEVRTPFGASAAQPYTVHIERLNGVARDHLACLTRKTHAFAKREATWDAAVGLWVFVHNWLTPHRALRRPLAEPAGGRRDAPCTPAMAQALATAPWTWQDFLTRPVRHWL